MKLCTIIGARPQFVKAAVVSRAIAAEAGLSELLVHTGQHYDAEMSDIFFRDLGLPAPAHHLGIATAGAGHGAGTARMLAALEQMLQAERPDRVLVYGDTDSTLAGALAAAKLGIPVAHVEAGLRSFNRRMPEEINRVLTDHLADLLFAPTEAAMENLRAEGRPEQALRLVGDVMLDAARLFAPLARPPEWDGPAPARGAFVLATIHRAENTDDPARLSAIIEGLGTAGLPVVLPLHPRTRARIAASGLCLPPSLRPVAPVGYLEMLWLIDACRVVATDSGGLQKEACFLARPCVTFRDETEWPELLTSGWNRLVPADPGAISSAIIGASAPAGGAAPFGDGAASRRIAAMLAR